MRTLLALIIVACLTCAPIAAQDEPEDEYRFTSPFLTAEEFAARGGITSLEQLEQFASSDQDDEEENPAPPFLLDNYQNIFATYSLIDCAGFMAHITNYSVLQSECATGNIKSYEILLVANRGCFSCPPTP